MDINKVLDEYDASFGKYPLNQIQSFLSDKIKEAEEEQDTNSVITLLNELVGLCRSTMDQITARTSASKVIAMMEAMNLQNTEQYAITLINYATTLRVFKDHLGAMNNYRVAQGILESLDDVKPYSMASFYNNIGLLYFEMSDFTTARECFTKAVSFIANDASAQAQVDISMSHIRLTDIMLKPTYIEKCKQYYEYFGKEMLEQFFPEYIDRIAVGIVGEGSEKFGFDDAISNDHDLVIGFCMWLTREDYDKIGSQLNKYYNQLPKLSVTGLINNQASDRLGAFAIDDFYCHLLRINDLSQLDTIEDNLWRSLDEAYLASATNGQVFIDQLGVFTRYRQNLKAYYPKNIRREKLAGLIHEFSQTAQYNYPRSMVRKDYLTAIICKAKANEALMKILYLLEGQFAPYYKWLRKGLDSYQTYKPILDILDTIPMLPFEPEVYGDQYDPYKVYDEDKTVDAYERIAQLLLHILRRRKVVYGQSAFLDSYCMDIVKRNDIDQVVALEWNQFDKVQNQGGRASCQDDWNTFYIMRNSQFMAWPPELINSYYNDLVSADMSDRNLLAEKYGRMMESTAPDQYQQMRHLFPVLSEERIARQETIIATQVKMMEEYAKDYPALSGNARNIHTNEDSIYSTSYETYLRGELGTYSDNTLALYEEFINSIKASRKNLAYMVMCNTTMFYGYASIDQAEEKNRVIGI